MEASRMQRISLKRIVYERLNHEATAAAACCDAVAEACKHCYLQHVRCHCLKHNVLPYTFPLCKYLIVRKFGLCFERIYSVINYLRLGHLSKKKLIELNGASIAWKRCYRVCDIKLFTKNSLTEVWDKWIVATITTIALECNIVNLL